MIAARPIEAPLLSGPEREAFLARVRSESARRITA
jgi:hypothetical protein